MALSSALNFDIDYTNKRYRIVCSTDFLTEYGMDAAGLQLLILGTTYYGSDIIDQHNTVLDPFIDLAGGDTASGWYNLPLDSNDNIVQGNFTGTFSLRVAAANLQFTSITLPTTILTDGSLWLFDFLIAGNTLTLAGGTPQDVVVASVADSDPDVTITTSTTILSATHDGIDFDLTNPTATLSVNFTGCSLVDLDLNINADCNYGDFGSFTAFDDTNIGSQTLVSSTMRIKYPAWTQDEADPPADVVVTSTTGPISKTITDRLAKGTYTVILSNTMQITQTDGLVINYVLELTQEFKVVCTDNFCCLVACFDKLRAAHGLYLQSNTKISPLQYAYDMALGYYFEAQIYRSCGEYAKFQTASENLEEMIDAAGYCTCADEGCADETGWVQNISDTSYDLLLLLQSELQFKLYNGVPPVTQDSTQGVQVGAVKKDVNTGIMYQCTDNTVDAAVWAVYYDPRYLPVYKEYVCRLTQTAALAPSEAIVANNLTTTPIIWTRTSAGNYLGTLAATFTADKTEVTVVNNRISVASTMTGTWVSANTVLLNTKDDTNASSDGLLNETFVRIKVYN